MNQELEQIKSHPIRLTLLVLAVIGLGVVYLLQHHDALGLFCECVLSPWVHFSVNKTIRLLLNDMLMLTIIHLWFHDKSVTRLAIWIQLIDTLVLLPIYLILKLSLEGESELSSPLLSQFHRLIVNPTLMILLFPAIYFQRYRNRHHD